MIACMRACVHACMHACTLACMLAQSLAHMAVGRYHGFMWAGLDDKYLWLATKAEQSAEDERSMRSVIQTIVQTGTTSLKNDLQKGHNERFGMLKAEIRTASDAKLDSLKTDLKQLLCHQSKELTQRVCNSHHILVLSRGKDDMPDRIYELSEILVTITYQFFLTNEFLECRICDIHWMCKGLMQTV